MGHFDGKISYNAPAPNVSWTTSHVWLHYLLKGLQSNNEWFLGGLTYLLGGNPAVGPHCVDIERQAPAVLILANVVRDWTQNGSAVPTNVSNSLVLCAPFRCVCARKISRVLFLCIYCGKFLVHVHSGAQEMATCRIRSRVPSAIIAI